MMNHFLKITKKISLKTSILISVLLGFFTSYAVIAGTAVNNEFSRAGVLSHVYSSNLLARDYVIDVILPPGFNPQDQDKKYPVIYILDGYVHFPMTGFNMYLEQLVGDDGASKTPKAIVVGIEQPIMKYDWKIRTLDMTPTEIEKNGNVIGGGADKFLSFLNDELKPFINSTYSGDVNDQTILGHSLGGLFTLYTLFSQPESFDRYVIGSPTTWWDDDYIFELEDDFSEGNVDLKKHVYLFVGGDEVCNSDGELCGVAGVRKMTRKLKSRGYASLNVTKKVFKNEHHNSVVAPGYDQGLKFVMGRLTRKSK
ncbi:putative esterase [Shewanella denitrificans OS217]|uniref:Putative esterase n=3 Tax=Shewanella TaxID=22 RepID=Q12SN8_SHEDO|nr:putative esterase [Shewanella denitrificans OS217]